MGFFKNIDAIENIYFDLDKFILYENKMFEPKPDTPYNIIFKKYKKEHQITTLCKADNKDDELDYVINTCDNCPVLRLLESIGTNCAGFFKCSGVQREDEQPTHFEEL